VQHRAPDSRTDGVSGVLAIRQIPMSMCRPRVSNVYVFSRFLWVFTRKVKYVRPCPVKFPHFYFLAWRFERFSNKKHYSSPLHYFQK